MKIRSVVVFLLTVFVGVNLFAANGILPGNGTAASPYQIEDLADFHAFCNNASYHNAGVYTDLMTNIDLTGLTYDKPCISQIRDPLYNINSNGYVYHGVFNGNNHEVSNLSVLKYSYMYNSFAAGGFVGRLSVSGVLRNLRINVAFVDTRYQRYNSLLCGVNNGLIENCHVNGECHALETTTTGLLVGINEQGGYIVNCSASGIVLAKKGFDVGGFCGHNASTIVSSYSNCDVTAVEMYYAGGFVGNGSPIDYNHEGNGKVVDCYAIGSVFGIGSVSGNGYIGGFAGRAATDIINCFSSVSLSSTTGFESGFSYDFNPLGLSGLENCFWNSDIYPQNRPYNPKPVYFTLDETTGTLADNTGYIFNNDATAIGSPAWSTEGVFGGCLTFDGVNDYLVMTDYMSIPGSNSRTVSVWVKTTAATAGTISCWGDRVNGKLWQLMMDADGKYRIAVYGGTEKSSIAINDGQWHHIAVVLPYVENADISDCQLYFDGVLDTNTTVSATMAIDTAFEMDVTIGASLSNGSYVSYFNGSMDDYRIYSVPLSADDIVLLADMQEPLLDYCLTGMPTEQMQDINTYLNAGWNIVPADEATADSLWVIAEGEYPKFTWSQPRNDTVFFNIESLKGMTEADAISLLAASGITATVKYDCSRLVAAGKVISSESPVQVLRNATELTIVISTGIYDWSANPGVGTIDDPYQVSTPGMLFGMKNDQFYYFKLMNDLDLSNYTFTNGCVARSDFASARQFRGSFDGACHVVRNATISGYNEYSMTIDYSSGTKYVAGFFPVVTGSETVVRNLGLENIKITTDDSNTIYAGAFVGACDSPKIIYNCFVTGMIDGVYTSVYNRYLGGFAGYGVNIDQCFTDVEVKNIGDRQSGGFVAIGKFITNSYCSGSVNAPNALNVVPGGFIGSVIISGSVQNCYSTAKVTSSQTLANGFIGKGFNGIAGSVLNCFWDCQTSGVGTAGTVSNGATGLSTAQMQDINTFLDAGWDFTAADGNPAIWRMAADGYPFLVWERKIDLDNSGMVDLCDFAILARNWQMAESGDIATDLDKSGLTDMMDLELLITDWLNGE